MLDVDLSSWSLAFSALFIAGVIKGVTGLGYASCALPLLVVAVGLPSAMALIVVPAVATNVGLAITAGGLRETIARFKLLYLAMIPGILVGGQLLILASAVLAVQMLGFVIVTYALLALARPQFLLPPSWHMPLQMPTGFFNGVMTGLTGAQVMPLFPYIMSLDLEPQRMVQAINLAVIIGTSMMALGLMYHGMLTLALAGLSSLAAVPALLGVACGNATRRLLPVSAFRRISLLTLLLLGGLMVVRS